MKATVASRPSGTVQNIRTSPLSSTKERPGPPAWQGTVPAGWAARCEFWSRRLRLAAVSNARKSTACPANALTSEPPPGRRCLDEPGQPLGAGFVALRVHHPVDRSLAVGRWLFAKEIPCGRI